MSKKVAIEIHDFEEMINSNYLYIDKTEFIREWWEDGAWVTLISRPHRFGKTLNISMVNRFFSIEYRGQGKVFENLNIWKHEDFRVLQGTYPVINLSFARVRESIWEKAKEKIAETIRDTYLQYIHVRNSDTIKDYDKMCFDRVLERRMHITEVTSSLYILSRILSSYYGRRVIILLDEYDTPLREAYLLGYWDEMAYFIRSMFVTTFKTNEYLERALLMGIVAENRVSILSDLNSQVITTTSRHYATMFGFTEEELSTVLEENGLETQREDVKCWCGGFVYGEQWNMYNPAAVLNFVYSAGSCLTCDFERNNGCDILVEKLIREGGRYIKLQFEQLLREGVYKIPIEEHLMYDRLNGSGRDVWSFLIASGYLRVVSREKYSEDIYWEPEYELVFVNQDVRMRFEEMVCRKN